VANLLLVRSVTRRREFAIRLSMGASRWRLVRQLMAENLIIAMSSGGLALLGTVWTARTISSFLPSTTLPLSINGRVDGRVMLAAILVSVFTAVVSGALPALRASAVSPMSVLKDEALNTSGGLHKSRLTSGLVVAQIALSLLLLTCAGLFFRSLDKAQRADPGFDPNHVLLASFDLGPMGYNNAREIEFNQQLLARLRALPGVQSVTVADFSPLSFTIHSDGVMPEGYLPQPHESMEVDRGIVGPEYLQTLRTPLMAGRDFTEQDNANTQPVAIVNQAFVDRYWMGQSSIGKRVQWRGGWFTIVGVAANGKYRRIHSNPAPLILLPMAQTYGGDAILHIRTAGDPLALTSAVQRTVGELNSDVPLFNVTTLKVNMQMGSIFERISVTFAGAFGLLALILASVGIYGVVAYTTKQRTHEIGIRMALGAGKAIIFRQVLQQGLRLAVAGLAVGLAASVVLTRFLRSMIVGVGPNDLPTLSTAALLLCMVALAASLIPARRAASIEPMQALRIE
jgi:predicted permease